MFQDKRHRQQEAQAKSAPEAAAYHEPSIGGGGGDGGSGTAATMASNDNARGDSNNHLLCNTGCEETCILQHGKIKENEENCYLMVYVCKFNQCISSASI